MAPTSFASKHSEPSPDKTLVVIGSDAGTATLIGSILYKCGGIEMPLLEKLEKKGIRTYGEAVREIKSLPEEMYFYTPKNRWIVKDHSPPADVALLVLVISPSQIAEQLSNKRVVDQLTTLAPLFGLGKVVILINKLDAHDWSEDVFNLSVQSVRSALSDIGCSAQGIRAIPVSGTRGDNLIELSQNTPWYRVSASGIPFVTLLDEI